MTYWPFWLGGLALATVPLLHWSWLRRTFAVSGRVTAIVDGLRGTRRETAPAPAPMAANVLFLLGLVLGGVVAAVFAGALSPQLTLRGAEFERLLGEHSTWALLLGGVLVGFGTRMAGGCTSGHGLCGTSRLQRGSLLATATFFGVGILVSLAIGALG